MTQQGYDADVAIVGYGPTGVAAANALGAAGVSVVAFERDAAIYPRARAVTVNDWTMRCFQSVGLHEQLLADMDVTAGLRWITYSGQVLMHLEFPPTQTGFAASYAIYQPLMEQTLREGAARHESVCVRYGVEVTSVEQDDDGVTIAATDANTGAASSTRARFAIAADGGGSRTRQQLGVQLLGDTFPVTWVVIDAKVKRWWPERHILTFWSDRQRPVVDIALAKGNHRWEVPLRREETPDDFQTDEQLWSVLEELGVSHDDVDIHQHAFYQHHSRMADRWRVGRVFLAGDAGHLMPPWAGAGMQSGIRDAFNLSWKLVEVLAGRLPETVLDTYQAERQPSVGFFTAVAEQLGRIIKQELSEEEMAALAPPPGEEPPLPPLLWPPVIEGGWVRGNTAPDSAVGKFIPQPRAATAQGVFALLDDLLGNGFVLLGAGVDPATVLTADERAGWDALGARYLAVRAADQATDASDDIVDIDGTLLGWMRRFGARVVAVRPDRFVAAADTGGLAVPE